MPLLDPAAVRDHIDRRWADDAVPLLRDYVAIPAQSPVFDPAWAAHGHLDAAVDLVADWLRRAEIDWSVDVLRLEGRTPLVVAETPGTADDTVLIYGHLDKQPPMDGWREGLGPWTPVIDGDRLYGRGGGDDGYSAFAAATALEAVVRAGGGHGRVVLVIEASEESGSPDLPAYVDHLAERLGTVSLVVCLDSGCGTYDRLWTTTSLRGLVGLSLQVQLLDEGVHSGTSGLVADSFRVARRLLDRVEDSATGRVTIDELWDEPPPGRIHEADATAEVLGYDGIVKVPLVDGARPMSDDLAELELNRTWRPMMTVTGADGIPPIGEAGNVLRAATALKLSLRLPPTVDPSAAAAAVRHALTRDPPDGAAITVDGLESAPGWNAPATPEWLATALDTASSAHFGSPAAAQGEGGAIPFMALLGARFPDASFVVTGVLGPESNAHGPNEFLHVPTARRVSACVAHVLDAHGQRARASIAGP